MNFIFTIRAGVTPRATLDFNGVILVLEQTLCAVYMILLLFIKNLGAS